MLINNNKQQSEMEILALMLIIYFFIGAGVCLLICVNPNSPGILPAMNRLIFRKLPSTLSSIIRRLFGERVLNFFGSIKHYLMETNHPIVQIFYLLIAVVGFICYQIFGIFKHMPNPQISDYQVILANLLALTCFWVYYKACATGPGEVTTKNWKSLVEKYNLYYDGLVYKKDNKCKTCQLVKPARSKHCSICQMCVSKYDHHCVWIRQCVGQTNYKYFVSFLFLHAIWCLYLSIIGGVSLVQYLNRIKFWGMTFNMGGQNVRASPILAFQFLFMTETIFFFLIVMCAIMGSTLFIFVLYHFYLISQGQTTNERVKKNDEIDFYTKEIKIIKKISQGEGKSNDLDAQKTDQIQFKGEKLTLKQLQNYRQECEKRKAKLEKRISPVGFIQNLKEVFRQ